MKRLTSQTQSLYMFSTILGMIISVMTTEHLSSPLTFPQAVDCCRLDITQLRNL